MKSQMAKIRRVMLATTRGGRGRSVIVGGGGSSRPMVAASSVPEHLIEQAQAVLLGKSRQVIVRELQRTNLNVNQVCVLNVKVTEQAVDNLLAADDDDEDDEDYPGDHAMRELVLPEVGDLLRRPRYRTPRRT